MPPELGTQGVDQLAHLSVDRTGTPAMIIMLGHLEQTLARDVPATRHVFQKRNDIFLLFRTAEADDQDRIVILLLGSNIRQRSTVVFCLIHAYPPDKGNDEDIYSVGWRPEISRADRGALPRRDRHGEAARELSERDKEAEEYRPGMRTPCIRAVSPSWILIRSPMEPNMRRSRHLPRNERARR